MAEVDMKIDYTQLDRESIRTAEITNKYLKLLNIEKMNLKSLKGELKVQYRDQWLYYTGKASPDVYKENPFDIKLLKTDTDKFLDADQKLQLILKKIIVSEQKVEYLENLIKILNNRNFAIKNAIDFMKFTSGGF
jgi:hypothetical protein